MSNDQGDAFVLYELIPQNHYSPKSLKKVKRYDISACICQEKDRCQLGCLNRCSFTECRKSLCPCGDNCTNQRISRKQEPGLELEYMGEKGFGLIAKYDIPAGSFITQYMGQVVTTEEMRKQQQQYYRLGLKGTYFMDLEGDLVLDATSRGNKARFINHSCEPNCETQKWVVRGLPVVAIFAIKNIKAGEEVNYDYQLCYSGRIMQRVYQYKKLAPTIKRFKKFEKDLERPFSQSYSTYKATVSQLKHTVSNQEYQLWHKIFRHHECYCGSPKCRGWLSITSSEGTKDINFQENQENETMSQTSIISQSTLDSFDSNQDIKQTKKRGRKKKRNKDFEFVDRYDHRPQDLNTTLEDGPKLNIERITFIDQSKVSINGTAKGGLGESKRIKRSLDMGIDTQYPNSLKKRKSQQIKDKLNKVAQAQEINGQLQGGEVLQDQEHNYNNAIQDDFSDNSDQDHNDKVLNLQVRPPMAVWHSSSQSKQYLLDYQKSKQQQKSNGPQEDQSAPSYIVDLDQAQLKFQDELENATHQQQQQILQQKYLQMRQRSNLPKKSSKISKQHQVTDQVPSDQGVQYVQKKKKGRQSKKKLRELQQALAQQEDDVDQYLQNFEESLQNRQQISQQNISIQNQLFQLQQLQKDKDQRDNKDAGQIEGQIAQEELKQSYKARKHTQALLALQAKKPKWIYQSNDHTKGQAKHTYIKQSQHQDSMQQSPKQNVITKDFKRDKAKQIRQQLLSQQKFISIPQDSQGGNSLDQRLQAGRNKFLKIQRREQPTSPCLKDQDSTNPNDDTSKATIDQQKKQTDVQALPLSHTQLELQRKAKQAWLQQQQKYKQILEQHKYQQQLLGINQQQGDTHIDKIEDTLKYDSIQNNQQDKTPRKVNLDIVTNATTPKDLQSALDKIQTQQNLSDTQGLHQLSESNQQIFKLQNQKMQKLQEEHKQLLHEQEQNENELQNLKTEQELMPSQSQSEQQSAQKRSAFRGIFNIKSINKGDAKIQQDIQLQHSQSLNSSLQGTTSKTTKLKKWQRNQKDGQEKIFRYDKFGQPIQGRKKQRNKKLGSKRLIKSEKKIVKPQIQNKVTTKLEQPFSIQQSFQSSYSRDIHNSDMFYDSQKSPNLSRFNSQSNDLRPVYNDFLAKKSTPNILQGTKNTDIVNSSVLKDKVELIDISQKSAGKSTNKLSKDEIRKKVQSMQNYPSQTSFKPQMLEISQSSQSNQNRDLIKRNLDIQMQDVQKTPGIKENLKSTNEISAVKKYGKDQEKNNNLHKDNSNPEVVDKQEQSINQRSRKDEVENTIIPQNVKISEQKIQNNQFEELNDKIQIQNDSQNLGLKMNQQEASQTQGTNQNQQDQVIYNKQELKQDHQANYKNGQQNELLINMPQKVVENNLTENLGKADYNSQIKVDISDNYQNGLKLVGDIPQSAQQNTQRSDTQQQTQEVDIDKKVQQMDKSNKQLHAQEANKQQAELGSCKQQVQTQQLNPDNIQSQFKSQNQINLPTVTNKDVNVEEQNLPSKQPQDIINANKYNLTQTKTEQDQQIQKQPLVCATSNSKVPNFQALKEQYKAFLKATGSKNASISSFIEQFKRNREQEKDQQCNETTQKN